ncbi:MAG: holo-ACP synthase [Acidimicrobiales bacterium]|jgi:holo-[acyl-carrier protein] synthase
MTPSHSLADDVATGLPDAVASRPDRGHPDSSSSLRVGIDLVSVSDVADSVRRFGDHYVHRIFTPHEVDCCLLGGRTPGYSSESLAARFAAKEAVVKVLRPVGPRPEWRDIEVYRDRSGWTEIRLSGQADVLAAEAGIDHLAVSLTHEVSTAAAVVIGVCRGGDPALARGTLERRKE